MDQQKRMFVIIWSALAVAQIIYLVIPVPRAESASSPPDVFLIALGVIAFTQSVGVVVLLRIRAFNPIQSSRLDPDSMEGAAQLFITLMISWVLAESVAIYGLVVRFLQFEFLQAMPFALAGAVLMFVARPWQSKLQKPASAMDRARSGTPIE